MGKKDYSRGVNDIYNKLQIQKQKSSLESRSGL